MDIESAAKELGRSIAQSQEYRRYNKASQEVEQDPETRTLMEQLHELEAGIHESQERGEEIPEQLKQQYRDLVTGVQSKPGVQELLVSQDDYMKLMNRVNTLISDGIREGAQSRIITNF